MKPEDQEHEKKQGTTKQFWLVFLVVAALAGLIWYFTH
jgi:hypothetical protein